MQTNISDKIRLPARYGTGEKSVWIEYNEFITEVKPKLNLGQGLPDYHCPSHVPKALAEAALSENPLMNQYTRGFGHPRLVQSLAKLYSPLINREINPMSEIIVTVGAYEALFTTILGHVEPGDEVIVIEPFYDCYDPMILAAGGKAKFIALKPKKIHDKMTSAEWYIDEKELESLFSDRTKMFILNTPHNPLGKVFTREELEKIANLCKKYNVLCVSDEVYEWMVFEPLKHIRIATLPGMWERTITIGSAGKMFSVTGWKVGWAYGPANLIKNLQIVHQNCVYTHCTPVQEAVGRAIEFELSRWKTPECYMFSLARELLAKRDVLDRILKDNGFLTTLPEGGYFITAEYSNIANKLDLSTEKDKYKDTRFTKKFAKEASILTIPMTAFYSKDHKHLGENYIRFCFIKKDEVLAQTGTLLQEWHQKTK
ncbi:kynurenine aminotransferase-like [Plodia interpunctella]|uniref:kynurenine aminotransferase-like n=1 Tax=Plodia interpunctella TaxID=58824 RepID=UPI00236815EC|nr:kynurenine aminotransferase-like [Plodia interpunctella]XP_053601199.1 kynurenine aminotransferase-like [Plodia interpunctella]